MSEHHERILYPFSAIVGQERMKTALMLNAVDPSIGGVLIKGDRGTAKSTSVRSLAALLPEYDTVVGCEFSCDPNKPESMCRRCRDNKDLRVSRQRMRVIELPISATEDKVVGTLDISAAIKNGEKRFEPGILAEAHRNILYVDEVNLLNDHIVDVLLDAAAMGVNTVEREGISYSHPSRFILIGTMNPEEGDLRPQLLDRFGLCVNVVGIDDPETRLEIILRRADFERDPETFVSQWRPKDEEIAESIRKAKEILPDVRISREMLRKIVDICIDLGVDGHRGDITMMKTCSAIAAMTGRKEVIDEDIREAAVLVLAHRMKKMPFDDPDTDDRRTEDAVDRAEGKTSESETSVNGSPDGKSTKNFKSSGPFA